MIEAGCFLLHFEGRQYDIEQPGIDGYSRPSFIPSKPHDSRMFHCLECQDLSFVACLRWRTCSTGQRKLLMCPVAENPLLCALTLPKTLLFSHVCLGKLFQRCRVSVDARAWRELRYYCISGQLQYYFQRPQARRSVSGAIDVLAGERRVLQSREEAAKARSGVFLWSLFPCSAVIESVPACHHK